LCPVDDVVHDVPAQIGVVDALNLVTLHGWISDVVNDVANHVVVTGAEVIVVDAGAAASVRGIGGSRDVMHEIADDVYERALVKDSEASITADIESHNVYIVGVVLPDLRDACGPDLSGPLHVGDKTNTR